MKEDSKTIVKTSKADKDAARRKILRAMVVGGSAVTAARMTPDQWVKPTIESVVLPAHAQTSGAAGISSSGNFTSGPVIVQRMPNREEFIEELIAEDSLSEELLEFFLPSAQAALCNVACSVEFILQIPPPEEGDSNGYICVTGDSNGGSLIPIINSTTLGVAKLVDFYVNGATFAGNKWTVDAVNNFTNASTVVTLSSGGIGCPP